MDAQKPKKWSYNMWTGIMYGQIPVGLIAVWILIATFLVCLALKAIFF